MQHKARPSRVCKCYDTLMTSLKHNGGWSLAYLISEAQIAAPSATQTTPNILNVIIRMVMYIPNDAEVLKGFCVFLVDFFFLCGYIRQLQHYKRK